MYDLTKEELDSLAKLLPLALPWDKIAGFTLFLYLQDGKSQSMSTLPTDVLAKVLDDHLKDIQSGNINDLGGIQLGE